MAKMFYKLDEAMAKLGCDEPTLKEAVRRGDLREFRDGNTSNYKVEEIDRLAVTGALSGGETPAAPVEGEKKEEEELDLSGSLGEISLSDSDNPIPDLSATGSIGLADTGGISLSDVDTSGSTAGAEGADVGSGADLLDASAIDLAATGDEDIISFEDEGPDQTATGKGKDDTVVSSVGVSVFDEEDLDESADPAAKTAMSASAGGTGLEGVGSGSGLLDLTRESDDTSLGAELLDEIYPSDESGTGTIEMGEATRAGLEEAAPKAPDADTDEQEAVALEEAEEEEPEEKAKAPAPVAAMAPAGDVFVAGASGLVVVAIIVMCVAGLAVASMMRGVWPSILDFVYGKLWMFGVGAVVVAGAAMGLGVFLGRRSQS